MSMTADFLLEIGTEELPPKAIAQMTAALSERLGQSLQKSKAWNPQTGAVRLFWGPRRMAVFMSDVLLQTPDQEIERQGPFIDKAFNEQGEPLPAALGFAKSCGVEIDALARETTDKGERLVFRQTKPGPSAGELLKLAIPEAIDAIPVPKLMRWGQGDQQFVRPLHWLVALLGEEIVDVCVKGVTAGRESRGHRFHSSGNVSIAKPGSYQEALYQAKVMVDPFPRRELIAKALHDRAAQLALKPQIDEDLLDEVNALVEWPQVIDGGFDERLLRVPHEALIACMQVHQKFFPMFAADGQLSHRFLAVANIESRDPSLMQRGYEKVILPRLSDAAFFFDEDRKRGIEAMNERLHDVVFQQALGSTAAKVQRVKALSKHLAPWFSAKPDIAEKAAGLCKADLMSLMVGEFPELQGVMGHYYADASGLDSAVGCAIESHYLPRHASDAVPADAAGCTVAVADRLDTLVGIFSVGLLPSGNKDPYALRRAAVALIRICLEHEVDLSLEDLVDLALNKLPEGVDKGSDVRSKIIEFIVERARNYFEDRSIASKSLFSSAIGGAWSGLVDLRRRIDALRDFYERTESQQLAAADKRIRNILRKNRESLENDFVDATLLKDVEEQALYKKAKALGEKIESSSQQGAYEQALLALSELADPLEAFFERVMVMAENPQLRNNRLALLNELGKMMGSVGDLSQLNSG
jgi:glycyl-tRNA synthetase beta chain